MNGGERDASKVVSALPLSLFRRACLVTPAGICRFNGSIPQPPTGALMTSLPKVCGPHQLFLEGSGKFKSMYFNGRRDVVGYLIAL